MQKYIFFFNIATALNAIGNHSAWIRYYSAEISDYLAPIKIERTITGTLSLTLFFSKLFTKNSFTKIKTNK